MQTLAEITASLITNGVPADIATGVAANIFAEQQRIVAEAAAEATRKAEAAAGVKTWHGIRVKGMRGDRPSERFTVALSDGVAIEPANKGIDSKTGSPVLWPPMMWFASKDRNLLNLTQAQAVTLYRVVRGMGAEQFINALSMIGSDEAVTTYEAERSALEASGEIVGRKRK